jgi:hypothetical protein
MPPAPFRSKPYRPTSTSPQSGARHICAYGRLRCRPSPRVKHHSDPSWPPFRQLPKTGNPHVGLLANFPRNAGNLRSESAVTLPRNTHT